MSPCSQSSRIQSHPEARASILEMLALGVSCQYPRLDPAPLSRAILNVFPDAMAAIIAEWNQNGRE